MTAIQRHVERMQLVEYRSFLLALLGGTVVWLPALLLLFEALTGVNALGRIDLAFLGANLVVGLGLLTVGVVRSRIYVDRPGGGPRARRWIDALSGGGLRRARAHLDELARFVQEEAAPA